MGFFSFFLFSLLSDLYLAKLTFSFPFFFICVVRAVTVYVLHGALATCEQRLFVSVFAIPAPQLHHLVCQRYITPVCPLHTLHGFAGHTGALRCGARACLRCLYLRSPLLPQWPLCSHDAQGVRSLYSFFSCCFFFLLMWRWLMDDVWRMCVCVFVCLRVCVCTCLALSVPSAFVFFFRFLLFFCFLSVTAAPAVLRPLFFPLPRRLHLPSSPRSHCAHAGCSRCGATHAGVRGALLPLLLLFWCSRML